MTEQPVTDSVLSAKSAESPADLRRERLRAQSKLPRPAARKGSVERQLAELLAIPNHPIIRHYDRKYRAELRKAGQKKPSETLLQLAIRQHVMVDKIDENVLKEPGGPVHRRKRQLHAYIQQRTELVAGLMQLRLKLGLDAETVTVPLSFSDAFRRMVEEDQSKPLVDHAQILREARARGDAASPPATSPDPAPEAWRLAFMKGDMTGGDASPPEPAALPAPEVVAPASAPTRASREEHACEPLELAPDEPRKPVIEDLGNPRTTTTMRPPREAPSPVRDFRPDTIRHGVVSGGEWLPSPWNL